MRDRWQASGTYTLAWLYDNDPLPLSGLQQVTFGTVVTVLPRYDAKTRKIEIKTFKKGLTPQESVAAYRDAAEHREPRAGRRLQAERKDDRK